MMWRIVGLSLALSVRFLLALMLVAGSVVFMAGPLALAQSYTVLDLGVVEGKSQSWVLNACPLNNRGQVVGWANNTGPYDFVGDSAFLWSARIGTQSLAGLSGAVSTTSLAINDKGQIVGLSGDAFPNSRAVLWELGKVHDLGVLPGDTGGWAWNLNNRGQVVGISMLATPDALIFHAALWEQGHVFPLPELQEGTFHMAISINDRGQIVGTSGPDDTHRPAVIWENGTVRSLGTLGGDMGFGNCINSQGQAVGFTTTVDGALRAFLWENDVMTDISGGVESWATFINNRGQIVGARNPSGFPLEQYAVIWRNGMMIDLDTLLPADSGWRLIEADQINEHGEIAGIGIHNGAIRAYILSPR